MNFLRRFREIFLFRLEDIHWLRWQGVYVVVDYADTMSMSLLSIDYADSVSTYSRWQRGHDSDNADIDSIFSL